MRPPVPCPTATWRNDTYDSISPLRPELSMAGKTVIIIGGGSGIGRETALAFATAGATHVALLGRTEATLQKTSSSISSAGKTMFSVHVADITKSNTLEIAAAAIGKWHILVICSGYCPSLSKISTSSDETEWWKGFETNVRGTYLATTAFLPTANPSQATNVFLLTVTNLPGLSSYTSSKLAQAKIYEFLAAENPSIFIATINPGMIETDKFYRTGASPKNIPMDKVQLPAHFLVWMASTEAVFLRGRCAWANWDVDELMAQKDMILEGLFMTAGFKELPKM